MSRVGRTLRTAAISGLVVGVVGPQWILAARYQPPREGAVGASEFDVAVERGVVDEHVDLGGAFGREGHAVLPVAGASDADEVDLRVEVGASVRSGQLVAVGERPTESGGSSLRPIFFVSCPSTHLTDVEPGERSEAVPCLQLMLIGRGSIVPRDEIDGAVLGAGTQSGLAALYRSAGVEPPVTEADLDAKRLDAEAAVLTAKAALAAVLPGDTAGAEIARLRVQSATVQRDRLRDRSGVRLVADDFLVAPAEEVVVDGAAADDGSGVGVSVSWGRPVLTVDVPGTVWRNVAEAVDHRLVAGAATAGLVSVSSAPTSDATQRVVFVAAPAAADAEAFAGAVAAGPPTVRFVVRTTVTPVVSVPAVAVRRDGSGSFVTVRSDGRRRRIDVVETDRIGGRSILAGDDALDGIDDVLVS